MYRSCVGNKASSCGHGLSMVNRPSRLVFHHSLTRPTWHSSVVGAGMLAPTAASHAAPTSLPGAARCLSSPSAVRVKQQALDRDVIVSVLEASATRRDARSYLQKYAPKSPKSPAGPSRLVEDQQLQSANVAIMNLRTPQHLHSETLHGIAKTLAQLRALGLLSLVIVDCGVEEDRSTFQMQALRLCEAIDSFGKPGAKLVENVLERQDQHRVALPSLFWDDVRVEDQGLLDRALRHGMITVIPSLARNDVTCAPQPADAHRTILALTKYLTGMQFEDLDDGHPPQHNHKKHSRKIASVERIILLDSLGGTPVPGRPGVCQRFVNIEQEYDTLLKHLMGPEGSPVANDDQTKGLVTTHAANLRLARDTLSLLPATSSALITTPFAAANTTSTSPSMPTLEIGDSRFGFDGMVITRKKHNPLLHNLLTDKPALSSSLPLQRIQAGTWNCLHAGESIDATLVKRGMPLTIYPNPRVTPWSPPKPGSPRLRLTDRCIDLPRLVNLIEDSFGRKLDLDDYLNRVNENLAGIIIAGEYEGGAILTWEQPDGIDPQTAYDEGRFVPYLDKFAVLKSRQGSGGVADIIFSAMVRDCFPSGVCWRSRKENPVNKWYFERSVGTSKLSDSNWTMFWTTLQLYGQHQTLRDYEAVCREIMPSWADNRHIVD